jgi:hypothetical protein
VSLSLHSVASHPWVAIAQVMALAYGRGHRTKLIELMNQKEVVGDVFNQLRLALQRRTVGRQAQTGAATGMEDRELAENMQKLLVLMSRLDQKIAPMLEADGEYFNQRWGYLSRAGLWDKSHLTRQIEKYDTSYISHFEGVRERQEEECLVLAKQQL